MATRIPPDVTELLGPGCSSTDMWLHDPANSVMLMPAPYQEITSPEIDAEHKQIVSAGAAVAAAMASMCIAGKEKRLN